MSGGGDSLFHDIQSSAVFADLPFRNLTDPRAAHDCAVALQERVDASAFAMNGINFWMLVRQFLSMQSARQANAVFSSLFAAPSVTGRVFESSEFGTEKVLRDVEVMPLARSALISTRRVDLDAIKGCLLFAEVPGDYTQYLGEHAVNAYADPVMRHFRARGHRVEKICRYQRRLVTKPKLEPPHYFTLAAAGEDFPGPHAGKIRFGVEAANRTLAEFGLRHRMDADALFRDIGIVLSARNSAREWLALIQPAMVFVQNFSNTEKMGVIAAARELGIPCVDLMHGMQDGGNIYHDHPSPSAGQTYLFPDSLWVWGGVTQRSLDLAGKRPGAAWKHAATSGYAWRSACQTWIRDPRAETLARLVPKDRRTVLYCHDASLHDDAFDSYLPSSVLSAIRASADDLFWLIRIHPRSYHLRSEISAYLNSLGLTNFDLTLSTECYLYDVFEICACVVVKYSVAGLEAASCGLPVITHHHVGAETFKDQIESGHVSFASDAGEILHLARNMTAPAESLDYVRSSPELLDKALEETLLFFDRN
jgi:hypothetical protein